MLMLHPGHNLTDAGFFILTHKVDLYDFSLSFLNYLMWMISAFGDLM